MANNSQLEKVTKFKYFGVTINQHLAWHDHIDQIQSLEKAWDFTENKTSASCLCHKNLGHDNGHPNT